MLTIADEGGQGVILGLGLGGTLARSCITPCSVGSVTFPNGDWECVSTFRTVKHFNQIVLRKLYPTKMFDS